MSSQAGGGEPPAGEEDPPATDPLSGNRLLGAVPAEAEADRNATAASEAHGDQEPGPGSALALVDSGPESEVRRRPPAVDTEAEPGVEEAEASESELPAHVLPIGGVIRALKASKRDPLLKGGAIYFVFLLNFCLVITMQRPVHDVWDLQDAVFAQLATEAMDPSGIHFEKTFYDCANWGDFWVWVDSVLYPAAYKCCYYND